MGRHLEMDRVLFVTVILLVFFGLVMVFSASAVTAERSQGTSYYYLGRQAAWATCGLLGMIWLMQRDYQRFRHPAVAFGFLGLAVIGLAAALLWDRTANTHRFLRLGPLSLQPSEFAKLALVVFLAYFLEARSAAIREWRTWGPAAAVLALLAGLVLLGRDLGTAFILVILGAVIFWAAGLPGRYFAVGLGVLAPLAALAVLLEPYRIERLLTFWEPWRDPQGRGFQIIQSMIAVGTGGFTGAGLMASKQKLYYLPAAHTDFIFAVISEELGLAGAAAVLAAYGVILWRGMQAGLKAQNRFGAYLAVGLTAMLVCQAWINISVVLALLPTKGMPLPFVGYGGSSLVAALWGAGMLLSVSQREA